MRTASAVALLLLCLLAHETRAATFVIKVGATNTVSFAPTALTVAVNDTVIFQFMRSGDRGEPFFLSGFFFVGVWPEPLWFVTRSTRGRMARRGIWSLVQS
jgi:hypothetical protein